MFSVAGISSISWSKWSTNYSFAQAGADLNFIDFDGGSYVMLAVKFDLPGIMKFLLDAGANPNIPDEVSFTCFPVLLLSLVIIYFHAYAVS